MRAERFMVAVCVVGMLLCVALAARAEESPAEPAIAPLVATTTTAAGITVVVTPEPATWRDGLISAQEFAEDAAVCSAWFGAPLVFFALEYPSFMALEHNSSDWRALPPDKQLHFVASAQVSGVLTAAIVSFPSEVPAWKIASVVGAACLGSGLAKEAADEGGFWAGQRDHGAEAGDLAADAAGCVAGVGAGAAIGTAFRLSAGLAIGASGGSVAASVGGRF